jgi:ribosomal protein S18 acetylase RimI-like enzyme
MLRHTTRLGVAFHIQSPLGDPDEDRATTSLLIQVFAGEGYTDRLRAENMSTPEALRQRGHLLLAKSPTGDLLGTVICARPTSPARQVAEPDEAELHLLAVDPKARGNGVAAALVTACEQQASSLGYARIVLSTQPTMRAAHRLYEKLGFQRNASRDWSVAETGKTYLVYEKCLS